MSLSCICFVLRYTVNRESEGRKKGTTKQTNREGEKTEINRGRVRNIVSTTN